MRPDAPPPRLPLVPASRLTMAYGPTCTSTLQLDRPSLVEFPVLYYPGLLRVTDNGQTIPYGNVARYVAAELPAGEHQVAITFTGVWWANWGSIAGIALVLAWIALPRRRARIENRETKIED